MSYDEKYLKTRPSFPPDKWAVVLRLATVDDAPLNPLVCEFLKDTIPVRTAHNSAVRSDMVRSKEDGALYVRFDSVNEQFGLDAIAKASTALTTGTEVLDLQGVELEARIAPSNSLSPDRSTDTNYLWMDDVTEEARDARQTALESGYELDFSDLDKLQEH